MPTLKLAGAPICLDILALESLSTVTTVMYSEPPCLEIDLLTYSSNLSACCDRTGTFPRSVFSKAGIVINVLSLL